MADYLLREFLISRDRRTLSNKAPREFGSGSYPGPIQDYTVD